MKADNQTVRSTRKKKDTIQPLNLSNKALVPSANLRLSFLTQEEGEALLELRGKEIAQIVDNIKNCINFYMSKKPQPSSLSNLKKISLLLGAPGTGKTSCLKYSLSALLLDLSQNSKLYSLLYSVKVLSLNGNSLCKVQDILQEVDKIISQQHTQIVRVRQVKVNGKGKLTLNILYIQEIEQVIANNHPEAVEKFVNFFQEETDEDGGQDTSKMLRVNKFMLLGASNSINLEQLLLQKINKTMSPSFTMLYTKIFSQYSLESHVKIIKSRFALIKQKLNINLIIPDNLIRYIVTKLSENKRDDTRNMIEVLKEIIIAVESRDQNKGSDGILEVEITLELINQIEKVKRMLRNSKVELIQKLTYKQHLILVILHNYFKRTDSLDMPYLQVVEQFKALHKSLGIIAYQQAKVALDELETYGCIQVRKSISSSKPKSQSKGKNSSSNSDKASSKKSILLKLNLRDIESTLGCSPTLSKYFSDT